MPNQCGFTSGVSITDAIHTTKILLETKVERRMFSWHSLTQKRHSIECQGLLFGKPSGHREYQNLPYPQSRTYNHISEKCRRIGTAMQYATSEIQGPTPWMILYADDILLIAESMVELQCTLIGQQHTLKTPCFQEKYT